MNKIIKDGLDSPVLILLFAVFLFPAASLFAQDSDREPESPELEDVIYLEDGSVFRGTIVEQNDEVIRIKSTNRNIYVVAAENIKEIRREPIPTEFHYPNPGYYNRTGVDLLAGSGTTTPNFYTVNGYRFHPQFAIGFGVGLTPYNDPLALVPVFLDVQVGLTKRSVMPFLFLQAGHNFTIDTDDHQNVESHRGGRTFTPGAGIQFNTSDGPGWYLMVGYTTDRASYSQRGWGGQDIENDLTFRRTSFGIGLAF